MGKMDCAKEIRKKVKRMALMFHFISKSFPYAEKQSIYIQCEHSKEIPFCKSFGSVMNILQRTFWCAIACCFIANQVLSGSDRFNKHNWLFHEAFVLPKGRSITPLFSGGFNLQVERKRYIDFLNITYNASGLYNGRSIHFGAHTLYYNLEDSPERVMTLLILTAPNISTMSVPTFADIPKCSNIPMNYPLRQVQNPFTARAMLFAQNEPYTYNESFLLKPEWLRYPSQNNVSFVVSATPRDADLGNGEIEKGIQWNFYFSFEELMNYDIFSWDKSDGDPPWDVVRFRLHVFHLAEPTSGTFLYVSEHDWHDYEIQIDPRIGGGVPIQNSACSFPKQRHDCTQSAWFAPDVQQCAHFCTGDGTYETNCQEFDCGTCLCPWYAPFSNEDECFYDPSSCRLPTPAPTSTPTQSPNSLPTQAPTPVPTEEEESSIGIIAAVVVVVILVGIVLGFFLAGTKTKIICVLIPIDQCLADRWSGKAFVLQLTWQGLRRPHSMISFKEPGTSEKKWVTLEQMKRLLMVDFWLENSNKLDTKCARKNKEVFDSKESEKKYVYWGQIHSCVCKLDDLRLADKGISGKIESKFWKVSKSTVCEKTR